MGDYNPRQITQMRWKDAKELEKFKFISGEFSCTNKTVEQNQSAPATNLANSTTDKAAIAPKQ